MTSTISIQGDKASFHDIAADQFFGNDSQRVFCDTFADTFTTIKEGRADFGLCAIENSLYGSINDVYDLLLKHELFIIGEVYLRIEQCLIGLPGSSISTISAVHSHPVALAQCETYLDTHLPLAERMEYHDTAASVEMIAQLGDPTVAAIASREAANLYGMTILAESIETNKENYTRFVALSRTRETMDHVSTKTSLIIKTDHTPGALTNALGCFAKRSINLSKIQSRPIIGKAWHYMFYIDIDVGSATDAFIQSAAELTAQGCHVEILGSYSGARL